MKNLLTAIQNAQNPGIKSGADLVARCLDAAFGDFNDMITGDLLMAIEERDKPLLLAEVTIQSSWYAITGNGLRAMESRRIARFAQNGSVHNMLTWERASLPVDDRFQFFEKLVRHHRHNPVAALASVQAKIYSQVIGPSFQSVQAPNGVGRKPSQARARVQAV